MTLYLLIRILDEFVHVVKVGSGINVLKVPPKSVHDVVGGRDIEVSVNVLDK